MAGADVFFFGLSAAGVASLLLAYLGKKLVRDRKAGLYQMAGFVVSCLVTGVSVYLYIDAHFIVERDRSSTAGLIFVAISVYLSAAGGILYGIVVMLQSHAKKRNK